ncbi:LacI family DNA-binding transcriptional regulator [Microbaculum marinum]|uniref:LacI family DNA-binding transcriptional regulator n=1 Tax=Microbaculum marinum TaxID=1764581 RepID=A0AAW9RB74_9HYPH
MRATISDIAKEAEVSTATVDRVLNNRSGVHTRTRDRVLQTAERLGYLSAAAGHNGAPRPGAVTRIDFLLPGGTNTFMDALAGHLRTNAEARGPEVDAHVHLIEGFNPDALARKLLDLQGKTDGVGVIALDHPTVREAIREVGGGGLPVLTMVSDISHVPRFGYIGIDNRAAGRLAGHLLGRFIRPGHNNVALFAGSLSYRGHEEREMGFRNILAEEFPDLRIVELREVKDDTERSYTEASALLESYDDIGGIYNIGAGNRGIARALEEHGRAGEVVFVGHELTVHTRRYLLSGTMDAVIDQNPRVEARDAVERLLAAARNQQPPNLPPIRIQAIFRENIPET